MGGENPQIYSQWIGSKGGLGNSKLMFRSEDHALNLEILDSD